MTAEHLAELRAVIVQSALERLLEQLDSGELSGFAPNPLSSEAFAQQRGIGTVICSPHQVDSLPREASASLPASSAPTAAGLL
jgi:hypothetical protein